MAAKISIIVPVYNVETLLKYCVDSLIRQTYTDIEILLIDDGSKDNSGALCDEYVKLDKRIKSFHKPNGGLSDARNFGIEHAEGDYYLFIDSDDVLHKDFCKVLFDLQQQYDADITSTDLINFYDAAEIEKLDALKVQPEVSVFMGAEILSEYYKPSGKQKIYHGLCMKLYRKELFAELRFEKGRFHEDLFITYHLLDACKTFVFINQPYYYYYQKNSGSITKNYRRKNLEDELAALTGMLEYFKGRDEVKIPLYTFALHHSATLIARTYLVEQDAAVLQIRKQLTEWIDRNLAVCLDVSKKELKVPLKIRLHKYLGFLRKIKRLLRG